jgi:uncharacterized peroxidase-related enzyme
VSFIDSVPESEESVAAVMRRYPQQARSLIALADNVMQSGECKFTRAERELISAYTSGINDCTYCYRTHKATAEALGVDEHLLETMLDDLEASSVDENLKPVLRFARKLTLTPATMVQADVDAIFDAGWDEDCHHYAVMICAMFNMMNRIMDGYGASNTENWRTEQGRTLARSGYGAVTDALNIQA